MDARRRLRTTASVIRLSCPPGGGLNVGVPGGAPGSPALRHSMALFESTSTGIRQELIAWSIDAA